MNFEIGIILHAHNWQDNLTYTITTNGCAFVCNQSALKRLMNESINSCPSTLKAFNNEF